MTALDSPAMQPDHSKDNGSTNPSGTTRPIWYAAPAPPSTTNGDELPRPDSLSTDVVIVGAGIAGLTCAYLLAKQGRSVIIVDEKPIAGGESGRTSAHLASIVDDRFMHIESMLGAKGAQVAHASHAAAIDLIERIITDESIDCGFGRVDAYLFAGDGVNNRQLEREFEAATRAGVADARLLDRCPAGGVRGEPCIAFPRQARFHPVMYLRQLAHIVAANGGRFILGRRVKDLSGDGPVRADLNSRESITAAAGIAATNVPTPINNWFGIYTKAAPYRTYMVGLEVEPGSITDALYWDMAIPYHYARLATDGERTVLIVGGEDHKVGHNPGQERASFDRLAEWARRWFPGAGEVLWTWSGQVSEPHDGLAYIGPAPTRSHKACYVITGDSGMGLTHGTLGAMIVTDQIMGRENPWADVYAPSRKPLLALKTFAEENIESTAHLIDYVTSGEVKSVEKVRPGKGAIMRSGLHKLAVYRDHDGVVHKCSAVCPHLKCLVHWNDAESSWDCPCHGSRFDAKGGLIMGPAVDDLEKA